MNQNSTMNPFIVEENDEKSEVRIRNIKELLKKVDEVHKLAQEIGIDSGLLESIVSNSVIVEPYLIIDLVQKKLGVKVTRKDRRKETVEARQVCIYLLKKFSRLSLSRIAQYVALGDHSGVLHHLNVLNGYMQYDERVRMLIETFERDIYAHYEKSKDDSNGIQKV